MRQTTSKGKTITELPIKPNCFLLLSGHKATKYDGMEDGGATYIISLLYRDEEKGMAVEWEPKYGPIQIFTRATETSEEKQEHYIFPVINPSGLDWTQMGVNDRGLPEAFIHGDLDFIFNVLRSYIHD